MGLSSVTLPKQAIKLLQQAEYKARANEARLNANHIQFDNAREVINSKYHQEWLAYCQENNLAPNYTFGDTLC